MATEILRKQPKDKKIAQIIKHFWDGKSLSEVTKLMGYKQQKNLTRFMSRSNYHWDKDKHNFVLMKSIAKPADSQKKVEQHEKDEQNNLQETVSDVPQSLALLLNEVSVIELLSKAKDILSVFDNIKDTAEVKSYSDPSTVYSLPHLYRKAQTYNQRQLVNVTKSFRIPYELNEDLNQFCGKTGLNQKQIVCVALNYFFKQHSFITDKDKKNEEE